MVVELLGSVLQHFTFLDIVYSLVVACVTVRAYKGRVEKLPLPPGPTSLPLVGNLLDLPEGYEGHHFSKYGDKYGPICSYAVLGQTFIIINDKKSRFRSLGEAFFRILQPTDFHIRRVGFQRWLMGTMPYDETFKMHRKLIRRAVGTRAALLKSEELKEIEVRRFLLRMLDNPGMMTEHLRALPSAIILKLSHGYTVEPEGVDPFVALADDVIGAAFAKGCAYGDWVVDLIPPLKYLPDWLPGMGFKKQARAWAKLVNEFCEKPFAFVKQQMANGQAVPSFTSEALEKGDTEHADLAKCVASAMYAGGSDTTVSGLNTAFLTLILHPKIFSRAREEIDRVIGTERLPTFSDRPELPYIDAIVKESLRWENVLDINLPHVSMEEDEYMGYRIPKGAVLIANIWQMTHDPKTYHDPFTFKPERFLGEDGKPIERDPKTMVFGFGRRICPGKEFADSTLWITIAMLIAVFDISKAKDSAGKDIEPVYSYVAGAVRHPRPFTCSVVPRSEKASSMIRTISEDYPLKKGDGEVLKTLVYNEVY